jgi:hypothetical protein
MEHRVGGQVSRPAGVASRNIDDDVAGLAVLIGEEVRERRLLRFAGFPVVDGEDRVADDEESLGVDFGDDERVSRPVSARVLGYQVPDPVAPPVRVGEKLRATRG